MAVVKLVRGARVAFQINQMSQSQEKIIECKAFQFRSTNQSWPILATKVLSPYYLLRYLGRSTLKMQNVHSAQRTRSQSSHQSIKSYTTQR
jgi:hypothetical protein